MFSKFIRPGIAFRRYEYGWGLGIHYFSNPYGGRGISLHFVLFYIHIHWLIKRDGFDTYAGDD